MWSETYLYSPVPSSALSLFPNASSFWEEQILQGHVHNSENKLDDINITKHLFPLPPWLTLDK